MGSRALRVASIGAFASLWALALPATAADDEADDAADDEGEKGDVAESGGYPADIDPDEDEHETYWLLGLRWRDIIVPGFQIRIFADDGPDVVNVFSVGPELTYRNHGLEIIPAVWYADYSMDDVTFRGNGDEDNELERVRSELKQIFVSVDIMFELYVEEQNRFAVSLGGGVGVGFVFGQLRRAQIYPNDPNDYDTRELADFSDCRAAGDPGIPFAGGQWCDAENNHYGNYREPSWANGGSKPNVFPWLAIPQLSFRYKPIRQLQVRTDMGWSLSGFFVGMAHSYGF